MEESLCDPIQDLLSTCIRIEYNTLREKYGRDSQLNNGGLKFMMSGDQVMIIVRLYVVQTSRLRGGGRSASYNTSRATH